MTFVNWFGRGGARIFYALLGIGLIACGALVLKYQSKLQIAATIENNPKAINKDKIKYSEGSIDLLNLYST